MYKVFSIVISIFFTSCVFAQEEFPENADGNICFTDVVSTSNQLDENQIFENIRDWISTKSSNFNRSNSEKNAQGTEVWLSTTKSNFAQIDALYKNDDPLKLVDKESLKLIGKVINKYTGGTMGCIRVIYFEYDLIVRIKEGRYKYEITNFTYSHYNQASGKQTQIYGFKDEGPCKSKGDLKDLLQCDRCQGEFDKLYTYLVNDINCFIGDMKTSIDKPPADENW